MFAKVCLTLVAVVGLVGGCTKANPNFQADELGIRDDGGPLDRGVFPDGAQKDGSLLDGWTGDGPRPDGVVPPRLDGPRPDGLRPDMPPREDARPLDFRVPDQRVPDQRVPDQRVPDQRVPDQRVPDQRVPDQGVPLDIALPPDGPTPTCQHNWQCNDKRSCTTDKCVAGHCQNSLKAGFCLISKVCRADGWSPYNDACSECVSKVSTSALTLVDGKICSISLTAQGMCVQKACRQWQQQKDVEPMSPSGTAVASTVLESVDIIGATKEIWAVGHYEPQKGADGGLIVRVDNSSSLPVQPHQVLTKEPLYDVSYRLAVGDSGAAYLHGSGGWASSAVIHTALGNGDRRGVFGAANSTISDVFYIAGLHNPQGSYGVVRCVQGPTFACNNNTGFGNNARLGPIFGVVGAGGLQGRFWVARQQSYYDDIYSKVGSGSSWSDSPPSGCRDGAGTGNAACSNTFGDYRGLHASSTSDAWVVGDNGMVLRNNGSGWQRITLPGTTPGDYQLTAVYSGSSDPITSVVGYVDFAGAVRQVALFNYNRKLDRWFGPLPIGTFPLVAGGAPGQIRHIGGSGYDNLWMVGEHPLGLLNPRPVGWVLQLK